MRVGLSHFVASLDETNEIVSVFGNFAQIKKNASLPRHIVNPMNAGDFVIYALQNGEWYSMGEVLGYNVFRLEVGSEVIYVCSNENSVRYILGAGRF